KLNLVADVEAELDEARAEAQLPGPAVLRVLLLEVASRKQRRDETVDAAPCNGEPVPKLPHGQAFRLRREELEHVDNPVCRLHDRPRRHLTLRVVLAYV